MKIGGKRRGRKHGGGLGDDEETVEQKIARLTLELQTEETKADSRDEARIEQLKAEINSLTNPAGGNMLQQAIVPATLILASNMLGKKGVRKMSSFTKRRSSRRKLNRRKRVSRRFRRGPR
jgi:hypothetical protein